MNVLFLTTGRFGNIEDHAIYPDLLRQFRDNGHNVYTVSTYEKRLGKETSYNEESGIHALRVKIGNLTGANIVEKGVSTLLIERQFLTAIKRYMSDVKFDLVMYSTPPITLVKVIDFIRKRDDAKSYLLLKDIFPQNAVDIGIMATTGLKAFLYKFFRTKEKKLYAISDQIGCMSQANVDYVLKHNPEVSSEKVEICPNCIEMQDMTLSDIEKRAMRERYAIPTDKKVFVYGGNLGKPQGIPFIIDCLKAAQNVKAFFLIVGDGTEYGKLESFVKTENLSNVRLMKRLPKDDYDRMVASCDVGMIFLDHRFTIPNFPSRLLSYMQASLPVLACTDPNTDIGRVIVDGGFGWWCESNNPNVVAQTICTICECDVKILGQNGFEYAKEHYTCEKAYRVIEKHFLEV